MRPPSTSSHLLIHIFYILNLPFPLAVRAAGTVSIKSDAGYASERSCAQNCICGSDDVLHFLGCSNTNGWLNDCFCRADLLSSANSFITSCVKKACSSNPAFIHVFCLQQLLLSCRRTGARYCASDDHGRRQLCYRNGSRSNYSRECIGHIQNCGHHSQLDLHVGNPQQ